MMDYSEETGVACQKCQAEDISGSITKEGKIACSKCMSARRDPWLWETYEGIGDVEATPEVRPNPQFEGTTPKKQGVGMFESDLWEHEMGGGTMRGGWKLPYARGGFAHSPRVTASKGSRYEPFGWEKVREYAQRPENQDKTIADISADLGYTKSAVSVALAGGEGRSSWAKFHPDLPRIEPKWTTQGKTRRRSALTLGETGTDWTEDERVRVRQEVVEVYKERIADPTRHIIDVIEEIAEEWNLGKKTVENWIRKAGAYDSARAHRERGSKATEKSLASAGVTASDILDYIQIMGSEGSDKDIAKALKISPHQVGRVRKEAGLPSHLKLEDERIKYYIIEHYDHMDINQMADALNIAKNVVGRHMRELGFVRGKLP